MKILESDKNKIRIEIDDKTFVNLLNDKIWEILKTSGYSAYNIDHPYLSNPVLIVKSDNPKKTMLTAADNIVSDIKALRMLFEHQFEGKE